MVRYNSIHLTNLKLKIILTVMPQCGSLKDNAFPPAAIESGFPKLQRTNWICVQFPNGDFITGIIKENMEYL
jgi:hypothetical protein